MQALGSCSFHAHPGLLSPILDVNSQSNNAVIALTIVLIHVPGLILHDSSAHINQSKIILFFF